MFDFKFTDNTDKFLQELERKERKFAEQAGMLIESAAKKNITEFQHNGKIGYVDTGRARNSITYTYSGKEAFTYKYEDNKGNKFSDEIPSAGDFSLNGITIYIGSNVKYFPYLESGTTKIQASHSLQRAITDNISTIQTMWIDILKE